MYKRQLVALAIADEYEHMAVASVHFVAERRADSRGHALSERASCQIDAGGLLAVGVGREVGVGLIEGIRFLNRIEALEPKGGIHGRSGMSLGHDAPVTVLSLIHI